MAGSDLQKPPTAPKRNRNQFVREAIPARERIASFVILLLIVGIGVAIAIKGRHFDPGRYALRTEALKSTEAAVDGKASTLHLQGQVQPGEEGVTTPTATVARKSQANPPTGEPSEGGGESGEGGESAAPKVALKKEPLEINLPGIKPMAATEFYSADNLFEKIDGRAPAYQGFNVQQMRCRSFSVTAAAGSFVDVYEFRFDTTVNAFGMFAMERDPKGKPLDFAPDGYSGEMGYFFRQGPVYVQVIASDVKPETLALTKAIAENRAKSLPVDDSGLAGRRKLPGAGIIPESVEFVLESAQGQAALKYVWQAKYKFSGAEFPFFLMVAKPDEAAAAWKSFFDFCAKFGKAETMPAGNGAQIFRAQVFDKWKVVFQRDGELGGAYDATDRVKAEQFVNEYLQGHLK
jgi:hypothetical protein